MATEEKAPEEEAVPAGAEEAGPTDAEAPEEDAPLAPIIVKKSKAAMAARTAVAGKLRWPT